MSRNFNKGIELKYHVSIFENMGMVVAGPHPKYGRGCF